MSMIAWIDDDIHIIEPVIQQIKDAGHEFIQMRTVRATLDAVEALRTCDLVLLDIILPPGSDEDFGYYSGVLLLRTLRKEHGITAPVIVFSVIDPSRIKEQLDPLNIAGYVRKPALPSELKRAVDAVLEAQRKSGAGE